MGRHHIVRKANDLVSAKYKLTLEEQRFIRYLISLIDKNDTDFKEYNITVQEFYEFSGFPNDGNFYRHFRNMSDSLLQKRIDLIENNVITHMCWLAQTKYFKHSGKISVQFAPALKPYLLQLKGNFTTYDLNNVRSLRSNFSIRIYELLKQYQKLNKRTFDVDELKALLGVEKNYTRYAEFKRDVIQRAQRELLAKCDISFDFREIKDSRKVTKLEFTIYQNPKEQSENINESTGMEINMPAAIDDKSSKKPSMANEASRSEDFIEYQRQKILVQMAFITEPLSVEQRLELYDLARGDVEHIKRKYHETDDRDIKDLYRYLRKTIPIHNENMKPVPKLRKQNAKQPIPEKKNEFTDFSQRQIDYDELEKLEMEQFMMSIGWENRVEKN